MSEHNVQTLTLFFHQLGPRDPTQVMRLCVEFIYALSRLLVQIYRSLSFIESTVVGGRSHDPEPDFSS